MNSGSGLAPTSAPDGFKIDLSFRDKYVTQKKNFQHESCAELIDLQSHQRKFDLKKRGSVDLGFTPSDLKLATSNSPCMVDEKM